jgi:ethanolamine ammonia-lyase small subunit
MDPWHTLRAFTQARIGQGSVGSAQRTESLIDFQVAHAEARDAVWKEWDCESFRRQVEQQFGSAIQVESKAGTRTLYLKRPDWGRSLSDESLEALKTSEAQGFDIALILSNGLSTTAVETHALPFLRVLRESLKGCGLSTSPIVLVRNGRVALSDEIGIALKSRVSLILIGERPGLSSADSLGAYLTIAPAHSNTDAERNCLSNIREPDGLDYRTAADKICYLTLKGLREGIGGVSLKDDSPDDPALLGQSLRLLACEGPDR